jgi:putative nucleotidyltransferase with HDIG domain
MAPDTNHEGASALAERLRAAIAKEFAARGDGVTVSLGVATFPDHAPSVEGVMHDAGQAVQAARRLGGDCAVVYDVHVARSLFAAIGGPREQSGADLGAVLGLAEVLDIRDTGTSSHSQTVGRYTEAIARELGLPAVAVDRLRLGGLLHDIGKIAVPDAVLKKAGPLTEAEWERMRKHPEIGALMLDAANLEDISRWVAAHHERPDGLGYPHGLVADEIPLGAKIVAVADAYEAMTADRPYRKALTAADARAELRRCAGTHFDEAVVEAFLVVLDRGAASREPGGRRDRSVPAAGDA